MLHRSEGPVLSARGSVSTWLAGRLKTRSLLVLTVAEVALLVAAAGSAAGQTTGTGPTVPQTAATTNPQVVSQVRYANEFSGSDIGAQVNSAFSNCRDACQVIIPAGSYAYSTTISMSKPGQSLIGAGAALTILTYTGSGNGINWRMNPFTVTGAGKISGITIHGTSSGTAGILSGAIIGASFEDLQIDGFTGSSGVCLELENIEGGWMERTVMSRVQLGTSTASTSCTTDMELAVNRGTASFGYNRWTDLKFAVNAGQTGILSNAGTSGLELYHSQLSFTCNASATSSTCLSLTGNSNWNNNIYNFVGESSATGVSSTCPETENIVTSPRNVISSGTAISVASGSSLTGYGVVDFPGMCLLNANGATSSGTFRIEGGLPGATVDGGTISSFLGSGNRATVYPTTSAGKDFPWGFGIIAGANIVSPYVAMFNSGGENAFVIATLRGSQAPNAMTQVARIDTSGNVHAAGAYFANGQDYAESVRVSGVPSQYEPGDLLAIDAQHNGRFAKTVKPYATSVAGIFSTRPGVLGSAHALGTNEFKSEIPLAITGIVPCKVTAENGPIHRGDLLVSSSRPGYAMRGTDRLRMTGAVIGKALEPLEAGSGVVQVLITLQ